MTYYICDTHALIWYITNNPQLGEAARNTFDLAEEGQVTIIIPTIVLAELIHISEKRRVEIDFDILMDTLKNVRNYIFVPLDVATIRAIQTTRVPEMHDRIIAATARLLNAKVITKDPHIKQAVDTVW